MCVERIGKRKGSERICVVERKRKKHTKARTFMGLGTRRRLHLLLKALATARLASACPTMCLSRRLTTCDGVMLAPSLYCSYTLGGEDDGGDDACAIQHLQPINTLPQTTHQWFCVGICFCCQCFCLMVNSGGVQVARASSKCCCCCIILEYCCHTGNKRLMLLNARKGRL